MVARNQKKCHTQSCHHDFVLKRGVISISISKHLWGEGINDFVISVVKVGVEVS